jgi:homoserine kinase
MSSVIRAKAPATVANVSCGFDVFGFAIHTPCDEVEIRLNNSGNVSFRNIIGDNGVLPREVHLNTAGVAVIQFLKAVKSHAGVEIILHKNLPLGSGMGSSAASAAAALVAVNHALGNPLQKKQLLVFAMEAERMACGAAHADNVAPSLLGGFVLIRNHELPDVIHIPVPDDLVCILIHPQIEIKTSEARQALRKTISLTDAVTQWGNTAALVAGLMKGDYELIGRSLHDTVAEPVRSIFIPRYHEVKQAALQAGAIGCGISGSGPSVFAFCKGESGAVAIASAMKRVFATAGLASEYYISKINAEGANIISA